MDSFSYTDDKAAGLIQIQMRANALTFPKPWEPLDSNQAMAFIDELRAELSSEHPLYGIPLHVIAQSCSADEYLTSNGGRLCRLSASYLEHQA